MLPRYLTTLVTVTLLSASISAQAQEANKALKQYNNTVKLATASVHIPHETGNFRPFGQVGAYYERRIVGNWSAGIGYMRWLTVPNGRGYDLKIGGLAFRQAYDMVDFYGSYNRVFGKAHMLNAGLGAAYTHGLNVYFSGIDNTPYGEDWLLHGKEESFWGLVPQLSYSYRFLHNRLRIGTDFRLRHYFGKLRPQYDIGAHIGFMF